MLVVCSNTTLMQSLLFIHRQAPNTQTFAVICSCMLKFANVISQLSIGQCCWFGIRMCCDTYNQFQ